MKRNRIIRMLGCADYEAKWMDESQMVQLTARGFLPCTNHYAQLEAGSEAWNMVFYTQKSCLETYTPFCLQAVMAVAENRSTIAVRDALGLHEIAIRPAVLGVPEQDEGQYCVYARKTAVRVPDETYFIQPAGTKVLPIFSHAYGPASKAECAAFIASANMDFMMELDQLHAKIERAEVGED